ncbi:hypothetical protein L6V77_21540 [Myxococcota bacterium]|nr:hypothetical protein [Myxococcota bacterium]
MNRVSLAFAAVLCACGGGGSGGGAGDTDASGGGEAGGSPGRPDASGGSAGGGSTGGSTGGSVTEDARPGGAQPPGDAGPGPGDQGPACPVGDEGCACTAEGDCNAGFYCEENICTTCLPGLPDCPCGARGTCGDGLVCIENTCVECDADTAGCPCGPRRACGAGLTCDADDDVCRPYLDCAGVTCAEHQVCRAAGNADAECLPECLPGYTWNAGAGRCDAVMNANCGAGAGSIAADCRALSRTCLESEDGASCGVCVDGTTDQGGALMACRPFETCASLRCGGENRGCVEPPAGEDATCGACLPGFADRGGACVADVPTTCVAGAAGSILPMCTAQNRTCVEEAGGAVCGACLPGFRLEGAACVALVPTCEPGSPTREACDDALRTCVDAPGGASCGACVDGYVDVDGACLSRVCDAAACLMENRSCDGAPIGGCGPCLEGFDAADPDDPQGACLPHRICDAQACPAGTFCEEQGGGLPPLCNDRPCPEGQALRQNTQNGLVISEACVPCQIRACNGAGETGRIGPYTMQNDDRCFCETLPGFFTSANDAGTRACDADADGWVNVTAATHLGPNADPHLRDNARCTVQTVERIALQNELGQVLGLQICDDGPRPDADGPCPNPGGYPLFEDEATDVPGGAFVVGNGNPPYPALDGRRLEAAEMNPLTRACAPGADANANGVLDVGEAQGVFPVDYDAQLRPFSRYAYFLELHTSAYEQNLPGGVACRSDDECGSDFCLGGRCGARRGTLTVRERSRCDADFPLGYLGAEADDGVPGDGEPTDGYWRSCVRNRDASYDADPLGDGPSAGIQQAAGFDFGAWSCDRAIDEGTCPVPPPVAAVPADRFERAPAHGICDTDPAQRAADLPWMGMNHHSQFKCVQVMAAFAELQPRVRPWETKAAEFYSEGGRADAPLVMNQCSLSPAAPGMPPSVRCTPVGGAAVRQGDVGFASVRYIDTSADGVYARGCIDEWKPAPVASVRRMPEDVRAWRDLCPGHRENPIGVLGAGNPAAFGRLSCGCTPHTGGAYCEVACADALFVGDNAAVPGCDPATGYCPFGTAIHEGRLGTWMCGGITTTSVSSEDPEAPPFLEGAGDDGATWRLRGEVPVQIRAEYMVENAAEPETGWRLR